ncbi:hypothetical protein NDU88_002214 [Pleurodeles waltl]|uniref:Uncharacterized protein n=1 Tax=Pleurodeles waltl TaxID=8319 RepID=A0AAV7W1T4_PLEWA|nr:hypothetical protein NDU88_002214 [Pleurodeles waltl]
MVPQDVQQFHGPPHVVQPIKNSPLCAFLLGVILGVPRPLSLSPQVIPSASPLTASPSLFPGAPPGPNSMPSGRLQQDQGHARSTGSRESTRWGEVPPGPSVPHGRSGTHNPAACSRHVVQRAAHSTPAAAHCTTQGHGFKREEGPQSSSRYRQISTVHCSPQVRGRVSATPPGGLLQGARTP